MLWIDSYGLIKVNMFKLSYNFKWCFKDDLKMSTSISREEAITDRQIGKIMIRKILIGKWNLKQQKIKHSS